MILYKIVQSDSSIKTGTPHGSVIGPLSFPLYVSPLLSKLQIIIGATSACIQMTHKLEDNEDTRAKMEACTGDA